MGHRNYSNFGSNESSAWLHRQNLESHRNKTRHVCIRCKIEQMSYLPHHIGIASSKIHFCNSIRNWSTRKGTTHHHSTWIQRFTVESINQTPLATTPKTANTTQALHGGIRIHTSQSEEQLTSRNDTRGTEAMAFLSTERSHGLTQQRWDLLVASTQQQYSAQGEKPAHSKDA